MLKYFCCHRDKKNGKNTEVLDILQGRLLIKKILDDNTKMAELARGFVLVLHRQEPPPSTAGRDFWLNSQWGSPEPPRGVVAMIIIFLLSVRKGENKKDIEDNLPSQRCTSSETREPTKSMAVFGDMTGIGDRPHQRAVLLWRGLQDYGHPSVSSLWTLRALEGWAL